jgi:putative FmdB family regulatory protein
VPIYEFVCESCSNEFEQIRSFSESRMPTCPQCGSAHVGRRMSRPAIHFKGSGWYITDSKKSSDNKGGDGKNGDGKSGEGKSSDAKTGSNGGESVKESSKSDSGSESKSETKAESKTESAGSGESKSAATPAASE